MGDSGTLELMGDSDLLLQALVQVWDELPALVGQAWTEFEGGLLIRLRVLEAAPQPQQAALNALLAFFDGFPGARDLLRTAYNALAPSRERATARAAPRIAGAVKHARYLDIPVFYATDRAPAANVRLDPFFTGERGHLTYGVAHVSVPDDHRLGELQKPKRWKLQFRNDPDRFVIVLAVEPEDRATFVCHAGATLDVADLPEALLFIHGYNVSFADAARRAAQIAYDLQFAGLTMVYSWPSEGVALRYPVDKANATWSLPRFREFLALVLSELGAQQVHAVAHSMGNEVLVNGLASFDSAALPAGSATLNEIVLAAPDVDAGQFRDLAQQFSRRARRCTLYASCRDKALLASQVLQKYPRAGQSGEGLVVVDGVETIDATGLDTGLVSHSYIGDNTSILSDVFYLLRGAPPNKRFGLAPVPCGTGRYWMFSSQKR